MEGCVGMGMVDCVGNGMDVCVDIDIDMDPCAETEREAPDMSGGSPMAISFDPQLHINRTHSYHWRQIKIIPF